jgi:hypothetical protein
MAAIKIGKDAFIAATTPTTIPLIVHTNPAQNGGNCFLNDLLRENKFPLAVRGENHDSPP